MWTPGGWRVRRAVNGEEGWVEGTISGGERGSQGKESDRFGRGRGEDDFVKVDDLRCMLAQLQDVALCYRFWVSVLDQSHQKLSGSGFESCAVKCSRGLRSYRVEDLWCWCR